MRYFCLRRDFAAHIQPPNRRLSCQAGRPLSQPMAGVSKPAAQLNPACVHSWHSPHSPMRNVFQIKGYIRNLRIIDRLPMLEGCSERRENMRVVPPPDKCRIGKWSQQEGPGLQIAGRAPVVPWSVRISPCVSVKEWRGFQKESQDNLCEAVRPLRNPLGSNRIRE